MRHNCKRNPLEPEWEGHVTLEFSNTTSLPAKIYANEGVAQMLFLNQMNYAKQVMRIGKANIKVNWVLHPQSLKILPDKLSTINILNNF